MTRTVTIIHPGSLGDVLLSLPAIRALRASLPQREVGLLAGREVGELLQACGEIDRLFSLEGDALASLLAGTARPRAEGPAGESLRDWLSHGDLAVGWMADPDGWLAGRLSDLGVGRVIVRSPHSADCRATHQADRFMETIRETVSAGPRAWQLRLPGEVLATARMRLEAVGALRQPRQPLVFIHPGSGSPHKCSEPGLSACLAGRLQTQGAIPMLVGGPADSEQLAKVAGLCAGRPPIFDGLDLLSAGGLLAQADLFFGHDSGLTHLAATLHVQTIALFGPTDCNRWAPTGPHVTVLNGAPCSCREQGWRAVQQCRDKPCLQVPAERLAFVCRQGLQRSKGWCRGQPARNPAPCHA